MSDPRLTQSPRALRDSTEDAEAYAKCKVQFDTNDSRHDPVKDDAWDFLGGGHGPEGFWSDDR